MDGGRVRVHPRRLFPPTLPVLIGIVLVATVLVGTVLVGVRSGRPGASSHAPSGVAAPAINDLTCDPADHGDARITVHLTIMIKGRVRDIPPTIGITGALVAFPSTGPTVTRAACYYWIHTGRDDGVIHVDAPPAARRSYSLGDFFDVWHQPLGTQAVGPDHGTVRSYLNNRPYPGNPRTIPLTDHAAIQLNVGQDTPPEPYTFTTETQTG
jgi:hypothetical protein